MQVYRVFPIEKKRNISKTKAKEKHFPIKLNQNRFSI